MGALSLLHYQFRINYPYYGLFRTADVKIVESGEDIIYHCEMINRSEIWLKKAGSQRWIDMESGSETPLTRLIGLYIDEFMNSVK